MIELEASCIQKEARTDLTLILFSYIYCSQNSFLTHYFSLFSFIHSFFLSTPFNYVYNFTIIKIHFSMPAVGPAMSPIRKIIIAHRCFKILYHF